jgi:hypothetical protein
MGSRPGPSADVFISLLDVQKQAFGGDICEHVHSFCKGRVKLPYGPMKWDVFGQLAFPLLQVIPVVTGDDVSLFHSGTLHPVLEVFFRFAVLSRPE